MCARRPTSAMPKSFLCCERAFCRSMVVMFCALKWSVLMSWCLLRGQVMWWSRHLMRCNGLCCVMSRDAMRCHGDELYYSSTTLYYKALLQYYSVLQILLCTTPVLPCTTKYYSSTTPVLPCTTKYYSTRVLQSTSWLIRITYETSFTISGATKGSLQLQQILRLPRIMNVMIEAHHIWNVIFNARSDRNLPPTSPNTAPATQKECHDWSASHMKGHVQCAEQQASPSNLTKYCACHAKGISWLIRITYETSLTMRGATGITLQPHQILRLPRKRNLMIDPHHIWNVTYNARSNRHHPPTSPNTAPATQNESHDWSASHMKRHLQCAEQQASPSNLTKYCAWVAKWISWFMHITFETSFTMRRATVNTLQPHQILRLPRKMNLMIDAHHIWNVIYNARSNSQHPPTSPNTAPATQNESHDWCTSHLKRHLQCAEQQSTPPTSPNTAPATQNESHDWCTSHLKHHLQCAEQQASTSNLTKYCACHAKLHSQILEKFTENSWSGISNARPIRAWSENIRPWSDHDPTQTTQNWTRRAAKATFRTRQEQILLKKKIFPLWLSFQISPHAAPATKSDTWTSPNAAPATKSETWTSPNAAPATKSDTWTSPNAAPATKSDTWTSPNAAPATQNCIP